MTLVKTSEPISILNIPIIHGSQLRYFIVEYIAYFLSYLLFVSFHCHLKKVTVKVAVVVIALASNSLYDCEKGLFCVRADFLHFWHFCNYAYELIYYSSTNISNHVLKNALL